MGHGVNHPDVALYPGVGEQVKRVQCPALLAFFGEIHRQPGGDRSGLLFAVSHLHHGFVDGQPDPVFNGSIGALNSSKGRFRVSPVLSAALGHIQFRF